jgi:hypothetical protein
VLARIRSTPHGGRSSARHALRRYNGRDPNAADTASQYVRQAHSVDSFTDATERRLGRNLRRTLPIGLCAAVQIDPDGQEASILPQFEPVTLVILPGA